MRRFCEGKPLRLCQRKNLLKFFREAIYNESPPQQIAFAPETTTLNTLEISESSNQQMENKIESEEREKQARGKMMVKNILNDFHQIFSD